MNVWAKEIAGMAWRILESDVTIQRDMEALLEVFLIFSAKSL